MQQECTKRKSIGEEKVETGESDDKRRLRKALAVAEKFKSKYLLEQQVNIELARTCAGLRNRIKDDGEEIHSLKCQIDRFEVKLCLTEVINKIENGSVYRDTVQVRTSVTTTATATDSASTLADNITPPLCSDDALHLYRCDDISFLTLPAISTVTARCTTGTTTTTTTTTTATSITAANTDPTASVVSTSGNSVNASSTATAKVARIGSPPRLFEHFVIVGANCEVN
jgi:hypothetical protein